MPRVERDPERGRAAAAKLKALGVKGILIKAAEQGYITQLACKMPECFCPEELGGACYFEPVSDELSDWMPTHEHFPRSKREGGHRDVDNAILAHRLCNRIDYSVSVGRPYARDLERVRKAREEATRRNHERSYGRFGKPGSKALENHLQIGMSDPGPDSSLIATHELSRSCGSRRSGRQRRNRRTGLWWSGSSR
jgi:hypothetical protein